MERFANQPLSATPHLAVFSSTKVGNFVVTTPLLRGLKEKYPSCILDFFGSELTQDLSANSPYIDFSYPLYSKRPDFLEGFTAAVKSRLAVAGPYDLAINCDEFSELNLVGVTAIRPQYLAGAGLKLDFTGKLPVGGDLTQQMLQDPDWDSPDFLQRYQGILTSNYIGELFCRLAYVETDFFRLELPGIPPPFPVPDVLVHITTTRSAKMWRPDYWQTVIQWCQDQAYTVGLIGSPPSVQQTLYHAGTTEDDLLHHTQMIDLRGKTNLIELMGTFQQARVCISVDAGPMHMAVAAGCPTIALFGNDVDGDGASPVRLWAPRMAHVFRPYATEKCLVCTQHRFKNEGCLVDGHPCMTSLQPEAVIELLEQILRPS